MSRTRRNSPSQDQLSHVRRLPPNLSTSTRSTWRTSSLRLLVKRTWTTKSTRSTHLLPSRRRPLFPFLSVSQEASPTAQRPRSRSSFSSSSESLVRRRAPPDRRTDSSAGTLPSLTANEQAWTSSTLSRPSSQFASSPLPRLVSDKLPPRSSSDTSRQPRPSRSRRLPSPTLFASSPPRRTTPLRSATTRSKSCHLRTRRDASRCSSTSTANSRSSLHTRFDRSRGRSSLCRSSRAWEELALRSTTSSPLTRSPSATATSAHPTPLLSPYLPASRSLPLLLQPNALLRNRHSGLLPRQLRDLSHLYRTSVKQRYRLRRNQHRSPSRSGVFPSSIPAATRTTT